MIADFKAALRDALSTRRKTLIAKIEEFVAARHDQENVSLQSLDQVTTRDLEWIAAAIDNC